MIYRTVLILLLISACMFSQEKHLIYFKEKPVQKGQTLNKSDRNYQKALGELNDRAIMRRMKSMGEDIISYEDIPIDENYISALNSAGVEVIHKLKWFNAVSARLTDAQIAIIQSLEFVDKIEKVKSLKFRNTFVNTEQIYKTEPATDYGPSFTQLNLSDIPLIHSNGITGENVIIGLLDTGFDWQRHISLKDRNVIDEYDFVFNDNITSNESNDHPSQHDHGTLIFSIIGGYHDSTMIGASYNSSFILAKTEDIRSETRIEEDNYAAALIWMEGQGVDITSSSLGYSIFDDPGESYLYSDMDGKTTIVTRAAELAFLRGVTTVTSAGNEGNTSWFYITAPADGKNTIAVGAVNSANQIASFSGRGPTSDNRIKPDIVAMGVGVYGASAGTFSGYRSASGTSTSAPIVGGVAALLLSAHPHLRNTQIRSILLESSDNSRNPNNEIGYGLVSAKNAIEFPNLEFLNNSYILRKILFRNDIQLNSMVMNYSLDSINFIQLLPTFDRTNRFNFELPLLSQGQDVEFYFTYLDSAGLSYREPPDKNYKFTFGSLDISLNIIVEPEETDYVVSNPFPNPFVPAEHLRIRINFMSPGNELYKVSVIDVSGQRVSYFSGISVAGMNFIEWNGYSDSGYLCASGVYYFLIQLNGKEYGRKAVLLK